MESKWWEYYAVRYFVGTVIGASIVAFLNSHQGSPFKDSVTIIANSREATFLGVGLVAALGFAFCYVASSPMLTLHATRAHLRLTTIRHSIWRSSFSLTISVGIATVVLWQFLPPIAAAASGFVIGSQLSLVFLAMTTWFSVIESFYRELADARGSAVVTKEQSPAGWEYVTSYRHLREHGNAVSIVILEFVLADALLESPSQVRALGLVVVWLLPATFAWLLGSVLESRFVSKPLSSRG